MRGDVCSEKTYCLPFDARQNSQQHRLRLCIQPTFIEGLLCARHHSRCEGPAVNKTDTGLALKEFVAEWGERH